jgi:His-Xaa-Ser system protein HxsD
MTTTRREPSGGARRAVSWPVDFHQVTVPVDTAIYPLDVIYGAAYVLMDRAYVLLTPADSGGVDVKLSGRKPLDDEGLRQLGGEFANELTNQALRATLDESGRKIREYIVAKAHFFHDQGGYDVKSLLDATMLEAFDDDPLDIAVPWEEKYGDSGEK